ncbi:MULTISPECIES: hypothetical protein [unclassified Oceanispirochaeta]|uniref:hypothetical protein n=1 Tax=unclassified Oceanispirochaeta TaxID=2635722 RepID=UPI000E08D72F|nr:MULTISPECIES: hypothetical protein [unclassified Oceanispirochaeta]MBF9017998.1 hypothetical protein [Oceanispirochaeta sp. M2]NPD74510.1 hypothetical protein [Oceanispirochaeta sp. M1]RDG29622.1 hypothetical protein DV872_20615 [Oceanispirochaeta sp. M1]
MKYPVAERALKKWQTERLEKIDTGDSSVHYRFIFVGSTCNNGGTEFKAHLHAKISEDHIIQKAWIEIPEEEQEGAALMCASPSSDPAKAQPFFEGFKKDANFTGSPLEEIILAEVPLNHAGCLCYQPIINQKWKMALSTMHFDLNS